MNRGTVTRKLERLGLPLPKALARIVEIDRALGEMSTEAPTDALLADVRAGKLTDPTKIRAGIAKTAAALAAHDYARRILGDLDGPLDHLHRAAIAEDADELITSMRPIFTEAVAVLALGLDALGPDPRPEVADQSPGLARAYAQWSAALKQVRLIAQITNDIDSTLEAAWFIDATATDIDRAHADYPHGEVWGLVRAGHPLRLNLRREAQEIVDEAQRAAATQAQSTAAQALEEQEQYKARLRRQRGAQQVVKL
jgi:hypothetical protein